MSFSASVNCKTRSSSQISSKVQRERPAILLQICVSDKPISSPSSLPVRINARPIAPRTARSRSFLRRVNCCGFNILPFPFFRATISTDTISCGEICPTRPARCCNIGRGIFYCLHMSVPLIAAIAAQSKMTKTKKTAINKTLSVDPAIHAETSIKIAAATIATRAHEQKSKNNLINRFIRPPCPPLQSARLPMPL